MLTTAQVIDETKTVTRRLGWLRLAPGDQLCPVRKCMGLKRGEKMEILRKPIRVLSTRREPLRTMLDSVDYGLSECRREGFPGMTPSDFVGMFCSTHKGCTPETVVTRIEFSYDTE